MYNLEVPVSNVILVLAGIFAVYKTARKILPYYFTGLEVTFQSSLPGIVRGASGVVFMVVAVFGFLIGTVACIDGFKKTQKTVDQSGDISLNVSEEGKIDFYAAAVCGVFAIMMGWSALVLLNYTQIKETISDKKTVKEHNEFTWPEATALETLYPEDDDEGENSGGGEPVREEALIERVTLSNRFEVVPSCYPEVDEYVQSIDINYQQKAIHLCIQDAQVVRRWLKSIRVSTMPIDGISLESLMVRPLRSDGSHFYNYDFRKLRRFEWTNDFCRGTHVPATHHVKLRFEEVWQEEVLANGVHKFVKMEI